MVLLPCWSLQEALSEFEVVNMDGKTTDALTVRTILYVTQINLVCLEYPNTPGAKSSYFM